MMPCFKQAPENGIGSKSCACGQAWEEKGWVRGVIEGPEGNQEEMPSSRVVPPAKPISYN